MDRADSTNIAGDADRINGAAGTEKAKSAKNRKGSDGVKAVQYLYIKTNKIFFFTQIWKPTLQL